MFLTLPPELRTRVYEYVASANTTRRISTMYSNDENSSEYRITTSAITATCRLVHNEYEDVARKATTALEFTATNMDFNHIIHYFHHKIDAGYLTMLRLNRSIILVDVARNNDPGFAFDIDDFYDWALFLTDIELEAQYQSDRTTWMEIFESPNPDLVEMCVADENSTQAVRDKIGEIRDMAAVFDKAMWRAYPSFREEAQARRRREWDLRMAAEAHHAT